MAKSLKKIGQILVESGTITEIQLKEALENQKDIGGKLGEVLVKMGFIAEDKLQEVIAEKIGVPKLSLDDLELDKEVVDVIPPSIAREYTLIAIFKIGNTITLAMEDPLNFVAIDKVKYATKCEIKRVIATKREIENAIDKFYSINQTMEKTVDKIEADTSELNIDGLLQLKDIENITSDMPIVDLVNSIIVKAIKQKSSDIHIQPENQFLKVRYRIDGLMQETATLPIKALSPIVSRVKVMSNIDLSEKRVPHDGRFRINMNSNEIDFRVSTLPTIYGEKIVMRILDKSNLVLDISEMGFSQKNHERWLDIIKRPEGLILITGPTGSGKTTSLYAALSKINKPEKNIVTVEDPVEYKIGGIAQVQINEKSGLMFKTALRSIVRQNPDILMVGEVRDIDTAEICIRASLTGHLVLSTLHTSDAPVTATRLIDMGLEPYLVSTALTAVLAQRLVRVICSYCKVESNEEDQIATPLPSRMQNNGITHYVGKGCPRCNHTGYSGRTAIHELMILTPNIKRLITTKADHVAIRKAALNEGMISLLDDGLEKIKSGVTTLEEVLRVTHYEDSVLEHIEQSADGSENATTRIKKDAVNV